MALSFFYGMYKSAPMLAELTEKPKLSDEERVARNTAKQRAWEAEHYEQRRAYQLAYAVAQRQALLEAGCVPNPVGRPKKDPERLTRKVGAHRVRGKEAYRDYQRTYHRLYRARRRAEGWLSTPCGFIPPEHAEVLQRHRQELLRSPSLPTTNCSCSINHTTYSNQNGEHTS